MNHLREKILNEAIRIGDQLLDQAIHHPGGLSWKSVQLDPDPDIITWQEQESIYNGVCGIILFLLELHRQSGNAKYAQAAQQAMRWVETYVEKEVEAVPNFAFLTGRMSVPFTLLRMYAFTRQSDYLHRALQLTKTITAGIPENTIYEFINGLSGTLVGLLHIHAATQDTYVLNLITTLTNSMLRHVQHGEQGFCWDRSDTNIHALCGLSHGASGVGLAFLELGHYFNNDAFYWVAEQAFLYEQQYYSEELNNWFDLRSGIFTEVHEQEFAQAYASSDLNFFLTPKAMNAWCHGAAGIGLARIRAYELLRKEEYRRQAELAVTATKTTDMETMQTPRFASFNLCHGRGGNAEVMLEAYRVFGDEQYLTWALHVAQLGVQTHDEMGFYRSGSKFDGEDTSLFLGTAGIGYFYLRVLDPLHTPSLLAPCVRQTVAANPLPGPSVLSISLPELQQQIIGQLFPRTLRLLQEIAPEALQAHFEHTATIPTADSKAAWFDCIVEQEHCVSAHQAAALEDIAGLEGTKWQLEKAILSDSLLQFKADRKEKDLSRIFGLSDPDFRQLELLLDQDLRLYQTQWNWHESSDSLRPWLESPDEYYYLLIPKSYSAVKERPLTAFAYQVISCFTRPRCLTDVVEEVLLDYSEASPQQRQALQTAIVEQIKAAIQSGILLDPTQHPVNALALPSVSEPAWKE